MIQWRDEYGHFSSYAWFTLQFCFGVSIFTLGYLLGIRDQEEKETLKQKDW